MGLLFRSLRIGWGVRVMLIVEGSDSLGKTTLIETISHRLVERKIPHEVVHMSRPDEDAFDFFLDYKSMIKPHYIRDRFHLGALAYHESKLPPIQRGVLEGYLQSIGAVIVILYANDYRWYEKRLRADERQSILSLEKQCDGNHRFTCMVEQHSVMYDFEFNISPLLFEDEPRYVTASAATQIIETWIKRRKEAERWNS